ncbi:MAG: hypothetical protein IPM22_18645 [Betaproteobacteria bacterium]|nr:hypothetical protein [Betaproteobacteria bacterium]
MENPTNRYPGFDLRTSEGRAYVALGIWLRLALVGAVAAVTGIVQFLSGELPPVPALALVAGGGILAEIGRRKTAAALRLRADRRHAGVGAISPRRAWGARPLTATPVNRRRARGR